MTHVLLFIASIIILATALYIMLSVLGIIKTLVHKIVGTFVALGVLSYTTYMALVYVLDPIFYLGPLSAGIVCVILLAVIWSPKKQIR